MPAEGLMAMFDSCDPPQDRKSQELLRMIVTVGLLTLHRAWVGQGRFLQETSSLVNRSAN